MYVTISMKHSDCTKIYRAMSCKLKMSNTNSETARQTVIDRGERERQIDS